MLHENMTIARHMVHTKQVEEARAKRTSRDAKRARSFDGDSSKERLEIQDKLRFKKRVSNQVPSIFLKAYDDRVSNPKPRKGKDTSSLTENPTCGKCGKKQYGDCVKGTNNFFAYGKIGHKVRQFPNVRVQDKRSVQDQVSGSNEAP